MTPINRSPTLRYEQRQRDIIASAVSVLNKRGVRGMTLGEVALKLDLVPTAVIYYFKNKEELAAACFLDAIRRFRAFVAAGEAGTDARQRLALFLEAYMDFKRREALGEAPRIAVFNDVRALKSAPVNAEYVEMFRAFRELLTGPETQGLAKADRNARTHLLLSEISWTVIWLPRREPEDYGRVARRMFTVLTEGLATPGVDWSSLLVPALGAEPPAGGEMSRELFLRAATELINEEGYLGASVEKISARLNVTKGAFYHHNETKDQLVVACFERTFEVMRQAIRAAVAQGGDGVQVLYALAASLAQYQLSGAAPLLRTSALTAAPESIQPQLIAKFDRIASRIAGLISEGIADGSLRPIDANVGAQMTLEVINASGDLHHWVPSVTAETVAPLYVRPLFEGLLTSPLTSAR